MSFTAAYLCHLPAGGCLEPIGSVAASFSRQQHETAEGSLQRSSAERNDPLGQYIRNTFGEADYEEWRIEELNRRQREARRDARREAALVHLKARVKDWCDAFARRLHVRKERQV